MKRICPFRKEVVKEENITIAVKVTRTETKFMECYGNDCPYFNLDWGEKYCKK